MLTALRSLGGITNDHLYIGLAWKGAPQRTASRHSIQVKAEASALRGLPEIKPARVPGMGEGVPGDGFNSAQSARAATVGRACRRLREQRKLAAPKIRVLGFQPCTRPATDVLGAEALRCCGICRAMVGQGRTHQIRVPERLFREQKNSSGHRAGLSHKTDRTTS